MGRWSQYDEDAYRLPAGFSRIGYDADTGVYTYKDPSGNVYEGLPHQQYGALVPKGQNLSVRRPMFDKDNSHLKVDTKTAPKSFSDILSPDQVTTAFPISEGRFSTSSSGSSLDPKSRFINAVRRATMPKMHDVVNGMMKISTPRPSDTESIYEKLLPNDPRRLSESTPLMSERKGTPLTRSATSAGHNRSTDRSAASTHSRHSSSSPSLARSSTTSSHRSSSSTLVRSATNALSSSDLFRSATNTSARSDASLARSSTNASSRSVTSVGHLMTAQPVRTASMKDLPSVPSGPPGVSTSKSTRRSSASSSSRRRVVEAV